MAREGCHVYPQSRCIMWWEWSRTTCLRFGAEWCTGLGGEEATTADVVVHFDSVMAGRSGGCGCGLRTSVGASVRAFTLLLFNSFSCCLSINALSACLDARSLRSRVEFVCGDVTSRMWWDEVGAALVKGAELVTLGRSSFAPNWFPASSSLMAQAVYGFSELYDMSVEKASLCLEQTISALSPTSRLCIVDPGQKRHTSFSLNPSDYTLLSLMIHIEEIWRMY